MTDPNPCEALECAMREDPVEVCREMGCGHRWQREGAEDRKARAEKDAKGKEGGK